MPSLSAQVLNIGQDPQKRTRSDQSLSVGKLMASDRDEVLSFLAARAVHTVFMAGLIRDNGLVSPLNRGIPGVDKCHHCPHKS